MNNGETGGYYYWVYLERFNNSTLKKEEIKVPHLYKANGIAWDNDELIAHLKKLKNDMIKNDMFFASKKIESVKKSDLDYIIRPKKVDFVKKNGFNYNIIESRGYTEIKKSLPSFFTVNRTFI